MRPRAKSAGPRRLGACLPAPLRAALERHIDAGSRLEQAWRASVPEPLASRARPVRFEAGVLHVQVEASAWASRLRHQQPAFVARLARDPVFAGLTRIRVRVLPAAADPAAASAGASPGPSRLSAKAAETVARSAATIRDPGLRAALERLASAGTPANGPKRSR